jgi:hypothetical protein
LRLNEQRLRLRAEAALLQPRRDLLGLHVYLRVSHRADYIPAAFQEPLAETYLQADEEALGRAVE